MAIFEPKSVNIRPVISERYNSGAHRCFPVKNWIQGGEHAKSGPKGHEILMSNLNIQEHQSVIVGLNAFEAQEVSKNLFDATVILADRSPVLQYMGVCNEGGAGIRVFRGGAEEAFKLMMAAVEYCGYGPMVGKSLFFGIDGAADNFYSGRGIYNFSGDPNFGQEKLMAFYDGAMAKYPFLYMEDLFASTPDQYDQWAQFTAKYGNRVFVVADDIATTNARLVRPLIAGKIANTLLLKLNQIGTLMEGFEAARTAHRAGWYTCSSHRSQSGMDTMEVEVHLANAFPDEVRNLFGKWGGANLIERGNRYLYEELALKEFGSGVMFDKIDPSIKIKLAFPFAAPLNTGKQTLGIRMILEDGRTFEAVVPAGTSTGKTETSIMPLKDAIRIGEDIIKEMGLIGKAVGNLPKLFDMERTLLKIDIREAKLKNIIPQNATAGQVIEEAQVKKAIGGNTTLAFGLVLNRLLAAREGLPAWLHYRLAGMELEKSLRENPLDKKRDEEFYNFLI